MQIIVMRGINENVLTKEIVDGAWENGLRNLYLFIRDEYLGGVNGRWTDELPDEETMLSRLNNRLFIDLSISERSFNSIIEVHVCARMIEYVRSQIDLSIYEMGGADAEIIRRYFLEEVIPWKNLVYHKLLGKYWLCNKEVGKDVWLVEVSKDFSELTFWDRTDRRKGGLWVLRHTGHGFYHDNVKRVDVMVRFVGPE